MIDLDKTIRLISGALMNAQATWQSYLPEADDWRKTALLLTGPLIVASAVIAYVMSLVFPGSEFAAQFRPTIVTTLGTIILSAIGAGVVAFIISMLAGLFDGKDSFARGLAATTLAFVPGYVGQALTWLPWIGGLLAMGLGIYGLVLLWKIIPLYLEVPDSKRVLHYVLTIVVTIVVMVIIGRIFSPVLYGSGASGTFG
jgi:hypothetical protein